jgi:hypothetical protein
MVSLSNSSMQSWAAQTTQPVLAHLKELVILISFESNDKSLPYPCENVVCNPALGRIWANSQMM